MAFSSGPRPDSGCHVCASDGDSLTGAQKLIMDQIYRKARASEIFAAIDEAPPELDAMIRHVFEQLDSNADINKQDLNTMLTWVALAKRPLSIRELEFLLSQPTGEQYMGLDKHLQGRFASIFKLHPPSALDLESLYMRSELFSGDSSGNSEDDFSFDSSDEDESRKGEDYEEGAGETGIHRSTERFGIEKVVRVSKSTMVEFSHLRIKELLLQVRYINLF